MKKNYFSVVSTLILLFSLIGFRDNLITDVGQPSNRDPKFVIHGLFCLAWVIAFAVQANLVRLGRFELHKQIGIAGFIAAVGVTLSTIYVFVEVWKPWDEMSFLAQRNRILLPSYALLILLAWINRRRPESHKRMICIATLYMLSPILFRAVGWGPLVVVIWNGLFVSLFVYDWVVSRRIHPVTYLGSGWFYFVSVVVAQT